MISSLSRVSMPSCWDVARIGADPRSCRAWRIPGLRALAGQWRQTGVQECRKGHENSSEWTRGRALGTRPWRLCCRQTTVRTHENHSPFLGKTQPSLTPDRVPITDSLTTPPKSNLANQWVYQAHLQEGKWAAPKAPHHQNAPPLHW